VQYVQSVGAKVLGAVLATAAYVTGRSSLTDLMSYDAWWVAQGRSEFWSPTERSACAWSLRLGTPARACRVPYAAEGHALQKLLENVLKARDHELRSRCIWCLGWRARELLEPHDCIPENGMKSFKEATYSLLKLFMSYSRYAISWSKCEPWPRTTTPGSRRSVT